MTTCFNVTLFVLSVDQILRGVPEEEITDLLFAYCGVVQSGGFLADLFWHGILMQTSYPHCGFFPSSQSYKLLTEWARGEAQRVNWFL